MEPRKKKPTSLVTIAGSMRRMVENFISDYRDAEEDDSDQLDVVDDFIDQVETLIESEYPKEEDS
jgi:hypothetical protein